MGTKKIRTPPAAPPRRVTLNRDEKMLFDEAVEQCHEAEDGIRDRLAGLGSWILRRVFAGDARAILEGTATADSKVWLALQSHAGGPTVRLTGKALSTVLRVAAWDQLIVDDSWRLLDRPRKALLLPLADTKLLREGARHVTSFRLTQRATTAYVQQTLHDLGAGDPEARLTPSRITSALGGLRARLTGAAVRRRLRQLGKEEEVRDALSREIDATIQQLQRAKRDLKGPR